jgi:DoxX-like family
MSVLGSPKTYAALGIFHAVDAVAAGVQVAPVKKVLDDVGVPDNIRPVIPVVKAAAAVGLLSVTRFPALARLTTAMLTLYFILAVGSHVRVRDKLTNIIPAATLLALVTAMTVKGPDQRP